MDDLAKVAVKISDPFVRPSKFENPNSSTSPKSLYHRALAGEIKNFTGVNAPYEPPENPELHLKAGERSADVLAQEVFDELVQRGIV